MQAITEVDGDTATVSTIHPSDRGRLAALLIEAAGPGNARAVRTVSVKGGGRAFVVPLSVAYAAGLIPEEAERVLSPEDTAVFDRMVTILDELNQAPAAHDGDPQFAVGGVVEPPAREEESAPAADSPDAATEPEPETEAAPAAVEVKKVPAKKAPAKKPAPKGAGDVE